MPHAAPVIAPLVSPNAQETDRGEAMPEAGLEPTLRHEQLAGPESMPECHSQGGRHTFLLGVSLRLSLAHLLG